MFTNLKQERMKLELKQIQVSKMIGMDNTRYSLIENGWVDPRPDEVKKIKKVIPAAFTK